MTKKLRRAFFKRDPRSCASELVGCTLFWDDCAGIIVETEAYSVLNDEACHTFLRPTARAFMATHDAGAAYIYLNYGMHLLLNVLVKGGSEDGFVLIRALDPTHGIAEMEQRRKTGKRTALCSGPGKLGQALGVTREDHGLDFCAHPSRYFVTPQTAVEVVTDVRIGISKAQDLEWRYLLSSSPHVSVRKK